MAALTITSGNSIVQAGDPLQNLYLIAKGSFEADMPGISVLLSKGDVIGLADIAFDAYSHTYTALEDSLVVPYAILSLSALSDMLRSQRDLGHFFFNSALKSALELLDSYILSQFNCSNLYDYLLERYEEYKQLCTRFGISPKYLPGMEDLSAFSPEEELPEWMNSYYEFFRSLPSAQKTPLMENPDFLSGFLIKLSQDLHLVMELEQTMNDYQGQIACLLLHENGLDFFDLFTSLYYKVYSISEDTMPLSALISKLMIQIEGTSSIPKRLYQSRFAEYRKRIEDLENTSPEELRQAASLHISGVTGSLRQILEYGDCDEEITLPLTENLDCYKKMLDKNAQDDTAKGVRQKITALFYRVYTDVFMVSTKDPQIPTVIRMFLNFGYMDEDLAGLDNASYLYSITEQFKGDPDHGIYTVYEWLLAIYHGKKSPSRNEFDVDYEGHLRELRLTNKITAEIEKRMLTNQAQKVLFELENMFPMVNKITFGRLSAYCPVFSEHNLLKELPNTMVTCERLTAALEEIRTADYSAFYRESVYSNPSLGIAKEFLSTEVLPDMILFPNVGTRAVMWQEIEGKKRATPARFCLSAFAMENLSALMIRLTGEYRWEMCKRIQGARWNDLSEPSLTSEYCDYLQFYRKNHDLSSDAKEKIKNALPKAKNSFKEMFVQDYLLWIQYEGIGSPRLNKVARNILFLYCPFAKPIRQKLTSNPLYKEPVEKYNIRTQQKLHHLNNLFRKMQSNGSAIPAEFQMQKEFLES